MKYEIPIITLTVRLTDAAEVTGSTSGLKSATVVPVSAEIAYWGASRVKVSLTGPKVKENGDLTAGHYTVDVDTHPVLPSIPGPPPWVLLMAEEVRPRLPEQPQEYKRSPGDLCFIEDTYVDHIDPTCELFGKKTDRRTCRVIS